MNRTASKGLHSIWISCMRRGFGRDHIAPGKCRYNKQLSLSIEIFIPNSSRNLQSGRAAHMCCVQQQKGKINKERLPWINQKDSRNLQCRGVVTVKTHSGEPQDWHCSLFYFVSCLKWWPKDSSFYSKREVFSPGSDRRNLRWGPKCIQRLLKNPDKTERAVKLKDNN